MRSMGESIGIGLEASSTSKSPQGKTMEPMDSTKVTYCIGLFGKSFRFFFVKMKDSFRIINKYFIKLYIDRSGPTPFAIFLVVA